MTYRHLTTRAATLLAGGFIVAACASTMAEPPMAAPAAPAPTAQAPAAPTPAAVAPAATPAAAPTAATPAGAQAGQAAGGRGRGAAPAPPPPIPDLPARMPAPVRPIISEAAPSPDPRIGLRAGYWDAAQAAWNMRLVSNTPPPAAYRGITSSDLAFTGNHVVQGNYNGILFWDVSNPERPVLVKDYQCPASQNDVSVFKHLLFVSSEGTNARLDCGTQGVPEPVSKERIRGIRIFDISNITDPKYVGNVQTCRGSHTHTVLTDPNDPEAVYVYISGSSGVRSAEELPGCADGSMADNPDTSRFRVEVIRVPLADPSKAAVTNYARIFNDLAPPPRRVEPGRAGGAGRGGAAAAAGGGAAATAAAGGRAGAAAGRGGRGGTPTGPNQCHDITTYPEAGLAGGACGGYGLLLDIREPTHPIRIDFAGDENMSFWHSATFSNDGTKLLFSDEWGGGRGARCRAEDRLEWGANAIFTVERGKLVFHSYYKMPAAQTEFENCVAHNGSLIPIPGREVMVQGFYQGGITVFDWTDVKKPYEIAFFDRGPLEDGRLTSAGSWSVYWYNGLIYSSEIARGLDVYELLPTPHISQNEIDAAKTVIFDEANAQEQKKFVWPPSFAMARAFVDQLERSRGLSTADITSTRSALTAAERASGDARRTALEQLGTTLNGKVSGSSDQAKVRMLVTAVNDLAGAR
jgi:hypothetical protein